MMRSSMIGAVLAATAGLLSGFGGAAAQFYNPGYRAAPPPVYQNYPPGQRFVPLDDDDDDIPRPRQRSQRPQPPGALTQPRRDADNEYRDIDLYADPAPRSRPRPLVGSRLAPRMAALPPDADPNYSGPQNFDDEVDDTQKTRRLVNDATGQTAGALTVDTRTRKLYLSLGDGRAVQYDIGVGRQGFEWKGAAQIGRKAVWPGWTPPKDMLLRRPDLPPHMEGGLDNPLGARALYLFKGAKDTLFRIHGTNEPETIGRAVSSGCIRMMNADVIDLYQRVQKGAKVVVL